MSFAVHKLDIGGVMLENNLVLAPLAGFTDVAFRRLCKESGAGLTVTEMVSVNGLKYGSDKTESLLRRVKKETPCAVQLFGSDPEVFRYVLERRECLSGFEIVDINMGCPMPKVTKLGAGSALLSDKVRAAEIVRACVESARRPVTVKMRLGKEDGGGAEEFAACLEKAGAAAVAVHGRTVKQLYGGKADWQAIARIKQALSVPVIGNGDVIDATTFKARIEESGADGIMIGRGALGRPWLFGEIIRGETADAADTAVRHIDYMVEYFSDEYATKAFRKHVAYYLRGRADSRSLKAALQSATCAEEMKSLLKEGLKGRG